MLTARFASSVSLVGSNASLAGYADINDGMAVLVDNTVANSATEVQALAFNKSKLRGVCVLANEVCTVTFGGVGNPSLTMAAGVPYVWHDASQITLPFGNNCTNLTVAVGNIAAGVRVQCQVILDPT